MGKRSSLAIILFIFLLALVGCSSEEGGINVVSGVNKAQVTTLENNVLLFNNYDGEHGIGDLYYLRPNEERKKVASDVKDGSFVYVAINESIFYQDKDNTLYFYKFGHEVKQVTTEVLLGSLIFSEDGNTIAYLKGDLSELYVQKVENDVLGDRKKVESNIGYGQYHLAHDGSLITYTDSNNSLFIKKGEEQTKRIASNVKTFFLTPSNNKILFISRDSELYVRDLNEDDNRKISTKDVAHVYISDDGSTITFIADYNYMNFKGELFLLKEDLSTQWIASDVVNFKMSSNGKRQYFVNDDGNLFERVVKDSSNTKLTSNVHNFSISLDGKHVIYLDDKDNLFTISDQKEPKRMAGDIKFYSVLGNHMIYLNTDGDLYSAKIGSDAQKISTKVLDYQVSLSRTSFVYINDADQVFLNVLNQESVKLLDDASKYSRVFFSNRLLYEKMMKLQDIVGYWKGEEGYTIEISSDKHLIFYYATEHLKYPFTITNESTDTLILVVKDEDSHDVRILVEYFNQDHLGLTALDGYDYEELHRVSKAEFDQIIAEQVNAKNQQAERSRLDELAYDIWYTWQTVPVGTVLREDADINAAVYGTLNETDQWFIEDTYVDDAGRIWCQIEVYDEWRYVYLWFVYQE